MRCVEVEVRKYGGKITFGGQSLFYMKTFLSILIGGSLFCASILTGASTPAEPVFPGKASTWQGFVRHDFQVDGRNVIVVSPKVSASTNPWIWRAEFFGSYANADAALAGKGFHVVYMDVQNMYGAPVAMGHFDALYKEMTQVYGLSPKPALEGLSRGGLFVYHYAALHPDRVSCLYCDAAVSDFKSWPGGKGKSKGSLTDWKRLMDVYGFKSEADALAYDQNPIDILKPIAEAKIPLFIVAGDADTTVPYTENSAIVKERFQKLGGSYTEIIKPGCAHHPHGLVDPTPIVDFVLKHASDPASPTTQK